MQTAFANAKYEEGYKYATEAMDHLRMNTSGDWHSKTDAARNAEKAQIAGETTGAKTAATTAKIRHEDAKKQTKAAEADVVAKKKVIEVTKELLHDKITRDGLDTKYIDPKNGPRNIDTRIADIDRVILSI
jgi:hypothetical protein